MTLREAIAEYTGIDYEAYPEREALAARDAGTWLQGRSDAGSWPA